jgi:DNA-binding CsgD family transcriptional regulator
MLRAVPLIVLILAFFSGPAAFVLLWLTYKKTSEAFLRSLAFSIFGLFLVLLGNATTMVFVTFVRPRDSRVGFLIMNEVFLASVLMGAFLGLFAHQITDSRLTTYRKIGFWAFTTICFSLELSLPIFLTASNIINVDIGYLTSTVYVILCLTYSAFLIFSRRARIPISFRGLLPPLFGMLLILGILSILNDIFHFGILLHGTNFPFSPLFFLAINSAIAGLCTRELLRARDEWKAPAESPVLEIGLSDREKEVFALIVQGLGNREIAAKLFISPHTVKNHITSIFRKAKVANRFELLKRITSSHS